MHFCYVDDSGDSHNGTTLTALIVEDQHWTGLLGAWLQGRRDIHREFGVPKSKEIHAVDLYKKRGSFCETPEQEKKFGENNRAAAGRMLLSALSKHQDFTVVTVASAEVVKPRVYAKFIAWLEDWAVLNDTYLLVFYDGQQGLGKPGESLTLEEQQALWESAGREAAPYREVHRGLDLDSRRIIEDVVMQDSKYSQLIQAADLIAYGAYHKHLQEHPEIWWKKPKTPVPAAIKAYMSLTRHWPQDSDYGVYWLDG